jgi:hypothetical protein
MKIPSVLQNLLTNKLVLNIVCVLSALNMIGYLVTGEITAILFFIVLAILITQFNKNMIIVLGIPLILVNLFVAKGFNFVEGMEGNSDTTSDTSDSTTSSDTSDSTAMTPPKAEALKKIAQKAQDTKTSGGTVMTPLESTETNESFEVGRAKRRGAGPQIDYASTVEDAYDNLNSILGGDGIKNLTADTQKLMKQQAELAKTMTSMVPMVESLQPMMEQAKSMMDGMGGDNKGMANIMEMAQKMGMGKK